jgi:hypothetical protein
VVPFLSSPVGVRRVGLLFEGHRPVLQRLSEGEGERTRQKAREESRRKAPAQVGRDHSCTARPSSPKRQARAAAHTWAATMSVALATHHSHMAWITNTSR